MKNGQFRTYGLAEGLPSDHLLNLFEQTNGRLIAMTANGPAVLENEKWVPIRDEGYPAGDHTWAMSQTRDGLVFAQGSTATLVCQDRIWQVCRADTGSSFGPGCVAHDGAQVVAILHNQNTLWFSRWDGTGLVKASGDVIRQGLGASCVGAAPDGSIWAAGGAQFSGGSTCRACGNGGPICRRPPWRIANIGSGLRAPMKPL